MADKPYHELWLEEQQERRDEVVEGRGDLLARGFTFGLSDRAKASQLLDSGEALSPAHAEYLAKKAATASQEENPVGSLALEVLGSLPTSAGFGGLALRGVTNPTVRQIMGLGAAEGGLYGLGTQGVEGGVVGATVGGLGAGAIGSIMSGGAARAIGDTAKAAVSKEARTTAMRRLKSELSDEEVMDETIKWTTRDTMVRNRGQYASAEEWAQKLDELRKSATKRGDDPDSVVMETPQPEIMFAPSLLEYYEYMTKGMGVPAKQVQRVLKKMGGLKFDDGIKSVDDLIAADNIFSKGLTGRTAGPVMRWYERNFTPVTEVLKRYYSPEVGLTMERVYERSMRHNANYMDNLLYPMQDVVKLAEQPSNKALLLDAHLKPENLKTFRETVKTQLGDDSLRKFDNWWNYSNKKNSEALTRLFRKDDDVDWDIVYLHSQKRSEMDTGFATKSHDPKYASIDALRTRDRKPASMMTEAELADYVNPLLAHSKYVMDNEVLLEGAKKFGLPPSLKRDGTTGSYFASLKDRLAREFGDEEAATDMANLLNEAYVGSKRTPPAPVRAFMNLAYAGTLAQLKSAVLNLHDIAVSMVNNGTVPTLRALFNRTDDVFGKTVRELMGEQNFGEFVREFDRLLLNPNLLDKISWGTKKVADGSMFISGFAYFDRVGKGVVLRSAVEAARDSAKKGRFVDEYADFVTDKSLLFGIQKELANDVVPANMTPLHRAVVEDIAFSKLGEQQLITAAGRPLGYLNHPILRPAYAMTGFAIKQQALLRRNVLDELKAGNPTKAAQYAAKYAIYAGIGYGFINETRQAVFKGDDFEPEGILLGAVDQVAAALTLNRLGDDYSREMFAANPIEYLMTSFLPPGGLTEAAGQAIMGDFKPIIERTPGAGDFLKRIMEDSDG